MITTKTPRRRNQDKIAVECEPTQKKKKSKDIIQTL